MNKGQTQAVTAVLITGVTLGAVAATYIWGTPLLEKREAEEELVQTEDQIQQLNQEIQSISQAGEGQATEFTLELHNDASIEITEGDADETKSEEDGMENNFIEIETPSDTSPYAQGQWFLLDGTSLQGLSIGAGMYGVDGSDRESVIATRSQGVEGANVITYRLEFRNILVETPAGDQLELVDIQTEGGDTAQGTTEITIRNEGTVSDVGNEGVELETGELIDRERTIVSLELD